MSGNHYGAGSASRLAAARLERSQNRADAARKTPNTTAQASYGSFWGGTSGAPPGPQLGGAAAAMASAPSNAPGLQRTKSVDQAGGILQQQQQQQQQGPPASNGEGAGSSKVPMAEIGVPAVPLSAGEAFSVCSREGALHENHDRGAVAVLADKSTVLFACLDGHGAEGASVSGYSLRNLLAGAAAALQSGKPAAEAVQFAFVRTSSTMPHMVNDCRFSGSTAILTVLQNTEKGRVVTTGWVGDSRAVVARTRPQQNAMRAQNPMLAVPLTKDHKPTDPKERARLAEARACVRPSRVINPHTGAWIEVGAVRVWDASQIYGVAMSRSLGDMQCHPFLIPTPDISSRVLDDKDKVLVLATDGVWDVMDNEEAVAVACGNKPDVSVKEIVASCASRWDTQMPGRRDDITAVVVDLTHPEMCVAPFISAWGGGERQG
jgi:serine/threonine protein phosphatase PrpC